MLCNLLFISNFQVDTSKHLEKKVWKTLQRQRPDCDETQTWCVCHATYQMYTRFQVHISKHEQTRQIWGIWKLRSAYSPETPNLGQNRWCFVPCDLEIWWMTLENNRAPLLCCFKLCATFHSHRWIQTGVAVRKRPIWVKFWRFLEPCDLEFHVWPSKTIGLLFYATSSSMHHFIGIGEFKLELQSGNAHIGSNLTIFRAVQPWNLTDDLAKQ